MNLKFRACTLGVLGLTLWLVSWQWATTIGPFAGTSGLPTFDETATTAADLLSRRWYWDAVAATVGISLMSLAIALIVGGAIGLVTGYSKIAYTILDPTIQFLRPLPPVVLIPLLVLIVGPSTALALILAVLGAAWPILIQVRAGVLATDPVALETARSLKLSWWGTQANVVLPSAFPYAATGVRIGAAASLMLTIGAGILVGAPGIGRLVTTAQETGQADLVFAVILWSGLLGLIYTGLVSVVETAVSSGRGPGGVHA